MDDATDYVALWADNDQGPYNIKQEAMETVLRGVPMADREQYVRECADALKAALAWTFDPDAYRDEFGGNPSEEWWESGLRKDLKTHGYGPSEVDWESLALNWLDYDA